MMMSTFSVFDYKYLSWANLVKEFKITCLNGNLIQRLFDCQFKLKSDISIEFNGDVHFFLISNRSILFLEICTKNQNCLLTLKFRT